jgi:formiminotetrahydrofolate cyclodeaminase
VPSAERPLADLLAALSARSPAPGGGSAAAWSGALAAGLLEMAAAFADRAETVQRAAELQAELLTCGELELRSYAPVLEAMRLPQSDPARARQLDEALSQASETPLAVAQACTEVAELGADVFELSKPALRGDSGAAVFLAEAAAQAAIRLVRINLATRGSDARLDEAGALAARAGAARQRVSRT